MIRTVVVGNYIYVTCDDYSFCQTMSVELPIDIDIPEDIVVRHVEKIIFDFCEFADIETKEIFLNLYFFNVKFEIERGLKSLFPEYYI